MTLEALETFFSHAALGLIVGFAYYLAMAMNANLIAKGAPVGGVKVLDGLRILAAVVFFAWLANIGALPVASAFAGFLCGRAIALHLFERQDGG